MATNHYESVVIINAALEDSQVEQTASAIQSNLKSTGGEITETDNWGRKRLAYPIDNAKSGYYLITRFTAPPTTIKEFERTLKLDENVIRYMTIALDKKALQHLKKTAQAQMEVATSKEVESKEKAVTEEK